MATISEALNLALRHHQDGRLEEAERIYREVLRADPNQADAIHLLGMIAYQLGRYELAATLINRAIALNGEAEAFHYNLAKVYDSLRRTPEAIASCRRALELKPDFALAHNNLGLALKEQGNLEEAIACYRRALELEPNLAEAHNNLGDALGAQGKLEGAIACFSRARELSPDFAGAHYNLGNALRDQGKPEEAVACHRRALEINPMLSEAHHGIGVACMDLGKSEEAAGCFRRALDLKPDFAAAHQHLGDAFKDLGRVEEAVACCRRALLLDPTSAEAHNSLGNALRDQGKLDDAIAAYRAALDRKPEAAEAHHNLGVTFKDQGKLNDAVACFERALQLKPGVAEVHHSLGVALMDQRRLDEAAACYRRAVELKPDFAEAYNDLGNTLKDLRKLDEAAAALRRALEIKPGSPEAHHNLGVIHLLRGEYHEGWRGYERRLECAPKPKPFSRPRWDGGRAEGQTIYIRAEQGFGDMLQFARYAPLVGPRSGSQRVLMEVPPALARLFAQNLGREMDMVAADNPEETSLPPFDCWVPLLSLPLTLRLFEPWPMNGPYLHADPELRRRWRARLEPVPGIRVGLVWAGNPAHKLDCVRSIPPEKLLPFLQIPGVRCYSLQIPSPRHPAASLESAGLVDLTMHIADFADTAALLAELDLIIAVDTGVAHLAGAMGRPVWTLLPFEREWRWGINGELTPWHPTMRLFSQATAGDWDAVVRRAASELSLLANGS